MGNILKKALHHTAAIWLLAISLILSCALPADAQGTIKRKPKVTTKTTTGTTTRKTTTGTKPKTRTSTTRTTPRTTTTTPRTTTTTPRTTTTDDDDEDDGWDDSKLENGFEIFGKPYYDFVDNATAQPDVRDAIKEHDNCKTGCLTDEAAIAVFGGNGYNSKGLCQDMRDELQWVNNKKYVITDVAYTDSGYWIIVYEDTKYKGSLPSGCKKKLDEFISDGEKILSISFSESGDFAIITNESYYASNDIDSKVIKSAIDIYGHVNSICITNRGTLVTCQNGIFYVNVPSGVIEKLKNQDFSPKVIRYTDSGTYIAFDGKGGKAWYM